MVPLLDTSVYRGQKTEMDLIDIILQSDWYFFGGMNKIDYYNTRCKMWCHVTRPNIMDLLWPGWQSGETQVKTWWGPIHCHPHSHLLHIPRFKEPGSMRSSHETSVEGENMCSRKHGHMYVCQAPVGRVMRGAGVGVVPILLYYHNLGRECEISKYTLNLWLRLTFLSNDHRGGGEIILCDNHTCVTSNWS